LIVIIGKIKFYLVTFKSTKIRKHGGVMQKYFNIVERVGISDKSIEEATENAVLTLPTESVSWFEVAEIRGRVNHENKL
jgi:flavin-binding protein dodecin